MAVAYVTDLVGEAVAGIAEPYNIGYPFTNLSISIDGGAVQNFTLTSGSARTAAQIVTDLSGLTGAVASVITFNGAPTVRIRTNSALGAASTIKFSSNATPANNVVGFAQTTYTGGAPISTLISSETKAQLINNIETALHPAGWTTITGAGSTDVTMESGTTPQGLRMRVRIRDNGGTAINLSIGNIFNSRNTTNSSSGSAFLVPKTHSGFQIIANKYQVFIFVRGTHELSGFACWGMPWLPPNLTGYLYEAMYMHSNAQFDNDNSIRASFRQSIYGCASGGNGGSYRVAITNGVVWENNNNSLNPGGHSLWMIRPLNTSSTSTRWADFTKPINDPIISWGFTSDNDEPRAMGLLWEAFVSYEAFPADQLFQAEGHTWQAITFNVVQDQQPTLFLKVL